jgi:hypothetical protein
VAAEDKAEGRRKKEEGRRWKAQSSKPGANHQSLTANNGTILEHIFWFFKGKIDRKKSGGGCRKEQTALARRMDLLYRCPGVRFIGRYAFMLNLGVEKRFALKLFF